MLLRELFQFPEDMADSEGTRQSIEANQPPVDMARPSNQPREKSPRKDSNVEKAKRIRNLARLKVRNTVHGTDNEDTPHKYNLGSHTSAFLNR